MNANKQDAGGEVTNPDNVGEMFYPSGDDVDKLIELAIQCGIDNRGTSWPLAMCRLRAKVRAEAALAASRANAGGDEPDKALLISMAMRCNHGFGLDNARSQEVQLSDMRRCWEEMTGRGFYHPSRRDFYLSALASSEPTPGGWVVIEEIDIAAQRKEG